MIIAWRSPATRRKAARLLLRWLVACALVLTPALDARLHAAQPHQANAPVVASIAAEQPADSDTGPASADHGAAHCCSQHASGVTPHAPLLAVALFRSDLITPLFLPLAPSDIGAPRRPPRA